ncbi:hemagglutinin repeat-containing protein, partial [bacterium]|nr:hemagglutinin repeat-containing protein [bacterium]
SEIGVGGNLTIYAKKNVTLQGSEINAAGDVEVNAKNVELLAAQNIEQTSSKTTTVSLGLYASTNNEAKAQGSANASATAGAEASASNSGTQSAAGASADASAQAGAQGSANASSKNSVDIARIQIDSNETMDVTNTGSAIKSGGNLKITATATLRTVGSTIEAEKDINVSAKDMSFEAVQDTSYSKSSSSTTTMGLYLDAGSEAKGEAKAGAGAKAGASASRSGAAVNAGASAEASAEAGAEASAEAKVGAGIQVKNNTSTTEEGSSTAVVSGIISKSGSITRTAENSITDTGTNI